MRSPVRAGAAAVVLFVTVSVLPACAGAGDAPTESAGADALSISWGSYDQLGMEAALSAFKTAHPDIEVTVDYVDNDQYISLLRTQLGAGTATDIVYVKPGDGNPTAIRQLAAGGFLENLSDRPWATEYDASNLPYTQYEGGTYLMAPTIASFLPAYNETALAAAGLSAPTTWSEVLDFCTQARAKGGAAYALGAQSTWQNWVFPYMTVPTFARVSEEKELPGATDESFADSPAWQDAIAQLKKMQEHGCFQDDVLGTSFENAIADTAAGDTFAVVSQVSILGALEQQNPDAEFAVHVFPATDDPDDIVLDAALGAGAAVNAKAKNKDAALEFVDFLASPEGVNAYSSAMLGTLPAITNDEFSIDTPALELMDTYRRDGRMRPFLDQDWSAPTLQSALETAVQKMFGGNASVEDVLTEMDKAKEKQ